MMTTKRWYQRIVAMAPILRTFEGRSFTQNELAIRLRPLRITGTWAIQQLKVTSSIEELINGHYQLTAAGSDWLKGME